MAVVFDRTRDLELILVLVASLLPWNFRSTIKGNGRCEAFRVWCKFKNVAYRVHGLAVEIGYPARLVGGLFGGELVPPSRTVTGCPAKVPPDWCK